MSYYNLPFYVYLTTHYLRTLKSLKIQRRVRIPPFILSRHLQALSIVYDTQIGFCLTSD